MREANLEIGGGSVGFIGVLQIVFIVLKLTKVISWSWFWVLSPFIFSVAFMVLVLLAIAVVVIMGRK